MKKPRYGSELSQNQAKGVTGGKGEFAFRLTLQSSNQPRQATYQKLLRAVIGCAFDVASKFRCIPRGAEMHDIAGFKGNAQAICQVDAFFLCQIKVQRRKKRCSLHWVCAHTGQERRRDWRRDIPDPVTGRKPFGQSGSQGRNG